MICQLLLSTHTHSCVCIDDTQALHTPTQPPPHTQKSCLHSYQLREESLNLWNLGKQLQTIGWWFHHLQSQADVLEKECEPGMCLNTDMASGEPTAAKPAGALGGL